MVRSVTGDSADATEVRQQNIEQSL